MTEQDGDRLFAWVVKAVVCGVLVAGTMGIRACYRGEEAMIDRQCHAFFSMAATRADTIRVMSRRYEGPTEGSVRDCADVMGKDVEAKRHK